MTFYLFMESLTTTAPIGHHFSVDFEGKCFMGVEGEEGGRCTGTEIFSLSRFDLK